MMDAPGFNAWHADVANSPACVRIVQRALGLPPQVVSNSLLTGTSGDPALVSLQEEATQALATFDSKRRVLATATALAQVT